VIRPPARVIAAAAAIVVLVFAENLFGRQLNAFFLAYPGIDKVLHFVEYAGIFFVAKWVAASAQVPARWQGVTALSAAFALSVVDETVQRLGPGRSVELLDVAANAAGCVFGYALSMAGARRLALCTAALLAGAAVSYDTHLRLRDFSRGLQYERAHRFGLARLHYQKALAAGLRTPVLYNSLSWVEVESGEGDPRKAVEYASIALSMRPDNPDFLDTYGWALHNAGRSEEALAPLERAYAQRPLMYCINYHIGSVYLSLGRRDLAASHFRQQMEMSRTREAPLAAQALARMESQQ
jgi:Tfp pilus assembly protein PilF/VanZ family protein